jgi:hypothetical protein
MQGVSGLGQGGVGAGGGWCLVPAVRHGEEDAAREELVADEQRVALVAHRGLSHAPLQKLRGGERLGGKV